MQEESSMARAWWQEVRMLRLGEMTLMSENNGKFVHVSTKDAVGR